MSTKKKLIISLTTLSLAIIAVFGVTFGVLAAQQQAVRNSFTVRYVADNVSATLTANYKKSSDDSATSLLNGQSESLTIATSDTYTASNPATLTGPSGPELANSIQLAAGEYIIFTYSFTNNYPANGRDLTVTLVDNTTKTNVNCYYYASSNSTESYATIKGTQGSENTTAPSTQTVAAQGTVYFFILVEIDDDYDGATYSSSTAAGLEWTLASIEHVGA